MSFREHLEKNVIYFFFACIATGVIGYHKILPYTNYTIVHGAFKTIEEFNREYVSIEKYQKQENQLYNYQLKYHELQTKYLKSISYKPNLAIQIGGPGYKTINDKIALWCSSVIETSSSAFNNIDIYKFDDFYYIFKYDKSKNKKELEADIRSIHKENPDLQCEIIDLNIHCLSKIFVEAEDFNCGNDIYICKTCN